MLFVHGLSFPQPLPQKHFHRICICEVSCLWKGGMWTGLGTFGYLMVLDGTCIYQNFQKVFEGPLVSQVHHRACVLFYGLENLEYIQEMLGFW